MSSNKVQVILMFIFGFSKVYSEEMSYSLEPLPDSVMELGEGPHWDVEKQSLYFVDIYKGSIHRYDLEENKTYHCKIENESMVSFIIPVEGAPNRYAVGIGRRVGVIQWDGTSQSCTVERIVFEVDSEPHLKENRFNDGKADPKGRLYAGTMRLEILGDMFKYRNGSLYRYAKGESPKKVKGEVGISNGLAWNAVTKKMYYIDSIALNVVQYDYDEKTGDISNQKVLIDFRVNGEKPNFVPDGMTIDKNGFLYVATFGASKIFKINPNNGNIQSEIEFPCEQITSSAFGGPNLDILFVTTSYKDGKPAPAGTTYKVTGLGPIGTVMTKVKL